MRKLTWLAGISALLIAGSLCFSDMALAQGRGQRGGQGGCPYWQSGQSQGKSPGYRKQTQQSPGYGSGKGIQQRRRDGSCNQGLGTASTPVTPATPQAQP
ncbi:MAG: hypothetical protein ACLFUU_05725 [Desulfobacteraceae bacterium]